MFLLFALVWNLLWAKYTISPLNFNALTYFTSQLLFFSISHLNFYFQPISHIISNICYYFTYGWPTCYCASVNILGYVWERENILMWHVSFFSHSSGSVFFFSQSSARSLSLLRSSSSTTSSKGIAIGETNYCCCWCKSEG